MNPAHATFVHAPTSTKPWKGIKSPSVTSNLRNGRTDLPVFEGDRKIRKQATWRLKKGIIFPSKKTPQMVDSDRPPPVFLEGAMTRAFSQPNTKRVRSLFAIGQSIIRTTIWWLFRAPFLAPALIQARRTLIARIDVPLNDRASIDDHNKKGGDEIGTENTLTAELDVYARPQVADKVMEMLGGESRCDARALTEIHTVVLYVHGGAWGSGDAKQYSPLANLLLYRSNSERICVCILSYSFYPRADIQEQAMQVEHALKFLRSRVSTRCKIVVLAHSSGAHVTTLALLNHAMAETNGKHNYSELANALILTAPPMDLAHHFLFESRKGVAFVSPMLPAAHADIDAALFDNVSPTMILERMQCSLYDIDIEANEQSVIPSFLEGDIAGSNVHLPQVNMENLAASKDTAVRHAEQNLKFPQTIVLASSCDTTVPFYSALRFATALRNKGVNARFLVYDGVQHEDFVTDWFETVRDDKEDNHALSPTIEEGSRSMIVDKNERMSRILDVSMKDAETRNSVLNHVLSSIVDSKEHKLCVMQQQRLSAAAAHVRDVIRIVDKVSKIGEVGANVPQI